MSLSLVIFLGLFVLFAVLAFARPVWGVSLYMLAFFACPPFWWWGNAIAHYRWSLYSGIVLLGVVMMSRFSSAAKHDPQFGPLAKRLCWIMVVLLGNATLVHIALSKTLAISAPTYILLAKFVLLYFLIINTIRTKNDVRIALMSMVIGAGYIGYEVTINDRGKLKSNRLEGVGAPGATSANDLAQLMITMLPIAGGLFLVGRWPDRIAMLFCAPFIMNVVLLCNSRGAFLAAIGGALAFIVVAPRQTRKRVLGLACLGGIALWFLLGDPRIVERFMTTFTSGEERDHSAASRLDYWKAGLRMVVDYPLGAGGDGFHDAHGGKYLAKMGYMFEARSVHNGYINEACNWGLQGVALRLGLFFFTLLLLRRSAVYCTQRNDITGAVVACSLMAGLMSFLIQSTFGDFLDEEWGYWLLAVAVAHSQVFARNATPSFAGRVQQVPQQRVVPRRRYVGGMSPQS